MATSDAIRDTLIRIARESQEKQRRRAALAGGRFVQTFDPVSVQRQMLGTRDTYLPNTTKAIAADLARMLNPPGGGGGDGSGGKVGLGSAFQNLVDKGKTTAEAAHEIERMENARVQLEAAKPLKKANIFGVPFSGKAWDIAKKLPMGAVKGTWNQFNTGMDLLSRPGLAMTTAMYDQAKDVKDLFSGEFKASEIGDVAKGFVPGGPTGLMRLPAAKRGLLKEKGKTHGGHDVLDVLGWETSGKKDIANKIAHAVAGFGVDVAADPTTYVGGFGTTSLAGKAGEELTQAGVKGVAKSQALREVEQMARTISKGPASKTKKLAPGEIQAVADRVRNSLHDLLTGPVRPSDRTARKIFDDAAQAAQTSGNPLSRQYHIDQAIEQIGNNIETALSKSAGKGAFQYKLGGVMGFGGGADVLKGTKLAEQLYSPLEALAGTPLGKVVNPIRNAKGKLVESGPLTKASQWFGFEQHFPGLTGRIRGAVRGKSYREFMARRKEVINTLKDVNPKKRREMTRMIETGGHYGIDDFDDAGRSMNDIMDDVKRYFKEMADQDISIGHKVDTDMMTKNYVYHFFKNPRKNKELIDEWRAYRKQQLKNNILGQTPEDLAADLESAKVFKGKKGKPGQKLEPIEDIAQLVLARQAKGNRDAMRTWYRTEVLNSYGELIPNDAARSYKGEMRKVDPNKLTPQMKKLAQDANGAYYLPKDLHDTFAKFDDLQSIGNQDVAAIWRGLDKFNRWFKFGATVPNPGYHVRNMLSDAMLSFFDNTDPRDYARVAMAKVRGRKGTPSFRAAGQVDMPYRDLFEGYRKRGAVGTFYNSELGPMGAGVGRQTIGMPSRITSGMRVGSEMREDFGRMAHYKSAFEQELKPLLKGKDLTKPDLVKELKDKAMDNAMDRVNKFNFDYTALTPFEQNIMKRAIPFYTFQRKAVPLMVEQMATNPSKMLLLDKASRAIQDMLGVEDNLPFAQFPVASFMNEPGFLRLNNEAEPSFGTFGDFMPQAIIPNALETDDPNQILPSILAKLNPAVRGAFETERGKTYFGNRKIDGPVDWALKEFDPLRGWWRGFDASRRRSGGGDVKDQIADFLGVPFHRATEEKVIGAAKYKEEHYKSELGKINKQLTDRGYEFVTTSKKGKRIYRIVDRINGDILYESDDPAEVREAANTLYP